MEKFDTLDFKLINPVKAGEEWAVWRDDDGNATILADYNVAEIYINDVEIAEIFRRAEEPYYLEEFGETADDKDSDEWNGYGHLPPAHLLDYLIDAPIEGTYAHDFGVYPVCCGYCGEPGCWSVTFKVKADEDFVYWYGFEHEHRDWEYNLTYKFRKADYDAALQKLKRFADEEAL